jgi:predicted nucleotidyltransferase
MDMSQGTVFPPQSGYNQFMTQEKLVTVLKKLSRTLKRLLGERLEAVYLYGSQARGDAQPDSDIDVLVVIKGDFNYFDMVKKVSRHTAKLSLEYETVISCVYVTKDDYEHRRTPLLLNVRREGIAV